MRVSDCRLGRKLTQSTRELSATFGQELRSQLHEISANLTKISEVCTNEAREARAKGVREMSWRLEKRHILRKLELITSDSLAYLGLLRQWADLQLKQPVAVYKPFFRSRPESLEVPLPPFTGGLDSQDEGYVVTLANVDNLLNSGKLIGQFTGFYRRDRCLQVATMFTWSDSSLILKVYLG